MQKQRNRYYHGKMLRSEDFICEQRYLLDQIKERTHLMLGEGILYGLHIYPGNQRKPYRSVREVLLMRKVIIYIWNRI